METLIWSALTLLGVLLFVWGVYGMAKERRPKGRMVECAVCGIELPASEATVLTGRVTWDRDAGSVTIAEYHRECLPEDQGIRYNE